MKLLSDSGNLENLEIYRVQGGKFSSTNAYFTINGLPYIFQSMPEDSLDLSNDYIKEGDCVRVVHKGVKLGGDRVQVISIKNFRNEISINSDMASPIVLSVLTVVMSIPLLYSMGNIPNIPIYIWILVLIVISSIVLPMFIACNTRYRAKKLNEK